MDRRAVLLGGLGTATVLAAGGVAALRSRGPQSPVPPPEGRAWASGAWTGNPMGTPRATQFGAWRGRALDLTLTYPERATFDKIRSSSWHVSTYAGFPGRLVYGLPLLPERQGEGTLAEVAAGRHDAVFHQVAKDLVGHGRGDAVVRVGWEANGPWYRWGATATTAPDFRRAFRHVATLLRGHSDRFVIGFDVSCGTGLSGSSDRTAALTLLYPGDDVVDVVGGDVYDVWKTRAWDEPSWTKALHPEGVVGLGDVVEFAAGHDKPFAVPEWGLWKADDHGGGDNPFFVERMHRFFSENASRMAYEAYFDEPDDYIRSSVFGPTGQNTRASERYRRLWSEKS